jgi:hypothetical protein
VQGVDIIKICEGDMGRQKLHGSLAFLDAPIPSQIRLQSSTKAYLIFPCEINFKNYDNELRVKCSNNDGGWAIYEWVIGENNFNKIQMRQSNLPKGIVISPKNTNLFAWVEGGSICIGKPFGDGQIDCTPLPKIVE